MLGLILDFYWFNTNQDPIQLTAQGSLATLKAITSVDPQSVADTWPRDDVIPLQVYNVSSQLGGGPLTAHICARRGTDFAALLAAPESEV